MLIAIPTPEGFYVSPELKISAHHGDWICQRCSARIPQGEWGGYKGLMHPNEPYVDAHNAWHESLVTKQDLEKGGEL